MKKKIKVCVLLLIPIAIMLIHFFARYSAVERSIYIDNIRYRLDWKLECARESTYTEKKSFDVDFYIRFTEVGVPNTELKTISEIKDRCINVLSQSKHAGMKTHLIFVSTNQGEYISLFIDEDGNVYEITCESSSQSSRYYHSEEEFEKAFSDCEIKFE